MDLTEEYARLVRDGRLQEDAAQRQVLTLLQPLLDWSRQPPRTGLRALLGARAPAPKGLYLWGGVGRGKSRLMDLLMGLAGAPRRRVHFHAFMQEVQAGLERARARGEADALRPVAASIAAQARLLALDEMQIDDIADAMIVGRLFRLLLDAGVVVVTTSNRPPEDLYPNGLNRGLFLPFIALIRERMLVHELASPTDYRRLRLGNAQTWFSPLDARARAQVDALWNTPGHSPAVPLVLQVKGREVVIPAYRDGEARAGFWDLCGQPLGPADYLALAGAVRLLVIDEVPRLSSQNFNQARRFVTLIDALYEARVRLVASAADLPEKLYLEGDGSFEFARAASRLREMTAPGWGASQEAAPAAASSA